DLRLCGERFLGRRAGELGYQTLAVVAIIVDVEKDRFHLMLFGDHLEKMIHRVYDGRKVLFYHLRILVDEYRAAALVELHLKMVVAKTEEVDRFFDVWFPLHVPSLFRILRVKSSVPP